MENEKVNTLKPGMLNYKLRKKTKFLKLIKIEFRSSLGFDSSRNTEEFRKMQ